MHLKGRKRRGFGLCESKTSGFKASIPGDDSKRQLHAKDVHQTDNANGSAENTQKLGDALA